MVHGKLNRFSLSLMFSYTQGLPIQNNVVPSHYRSRRQGSWVGDDIMEKAFTWRFGFDSVELRNFFKICQEQSNGECLMGSFSYSFVILVVMIGIM